MILALYWTSVNIIGVFIPPGIFQEQTKTELFGIDYNTGLYEPIELSGKNLYLAYKIKLNTNDIADD